MGLWELGDGKGQGRKVSMAGPSKVDSYAFTPYFLRLLRTTGMGNGDYHHLTIYAKTQSCCSAPHPITYPKQIYFVEFFFVVSQNCILNDLFSIIRKLRIIN